MGDDRDDAATQTATSSPSGPAAIAISAATAIGRFAVLGAIGAGGMGQVFSAYDPQLDRRVALKLLHGAGSVLERQRLVREAQALARLSHPNVVTVHEVGEHDGHVFVAMEFVEGATLREWIDEHPPGGRERLLRALELMRDAGQGIAAAHAAGLVHRDIKPRNILVGADGRVRVVDFGLARSTATESEELAATLKPEERDPMSSAESGPGASALLGASLTEADKIVGTPAYMAPEQFRRGPIDQSADQFSFCVTAWEALFGVRPYGGSLAAMLIAIDDGAFERPKDIEVPAAVESALRRGLSRRPSRRHRDLAALLAILEEAIATLRGQAPPRRKSRWALVGGVVAVATAGAFWLGARDDRCAGAEERFTGVWDSARKAEIAAAVRATGASFAPATWSRLEQNVDEWRTAWIAGFVDACESAQVRGTQSQQLMDQRMACLDDRQQRLVAYLELLASPTVEIIANADEAFATLPDVARCTDVDYVTHRGQRSDDPEIAAIEDAVLAEVVRARSLHAAGDFDGALAVARHAVAASEPSAWVRAQALLALGMALAEHRPREAVASLEEAYALARAGDNGDIAREAAEQMTRLLALKMFSAAAAKTWLVLAQAEAERGATPGVLARIGVLEARVLLATGNMAEAEKSLQAAFSRLELAGLEGTIAYADALATRSRMINSGDNVKDAEAALELATAIVGDDHPSLVYYELAVAEALSVDGDDASAVQHAQTAVDVVTRAFGPNSERISFALGRLAHLENRLGRLDQAIATNQRAIALREGTPRDAFLGALYEGMGYFLREKPDLAGASAAFGTALEIYSACLGERDAAAARAMISLGAIERRLGQRETGMQRMRVGLALAEESLGRLHPSVASVYDAFAEDALRDGRAEEAYDWNSKAHALLVAAHGEGTAPMLAMEVNMCESAQALDRTTEALEHCESAIAIAKTRRVADPMRTAVLENNYGAALIRAERYDEAATHFARALELWTETSGEDSMLVAIALSNVAEARLRQGDAHAAAELYRRSLVLRERLTSSTDASLVTPILGISEATLALGDVEEARTTAERALSIARTHAGDPRPRARAYEQLALALRATPSSAAQRARSLSSMREALATLDEIGPSVATDRARVQRWLDAH